MNPEDKKMLQNDILLAAEISRQFNIRNHDEAAKVVEFVHVRKPFLSPRGKAFQQRMETLLEDESATCTCMLCMQREAERGIFCGECLAVIDRSVNRDVKPEKLDGSVVEEENVEKPEVQAVEPEKAEAAFPEVEEKIQIDMELWGEDPKKKSKHNLPIWAKILVTVFFLTLFGVGVLLATGYQFPIGEIHVKNSEDGETVVIREYSNKDYDINEKEPLDAPEGMFDVRVGDYVGDSWDTGLISVYAYSVVSKEDPTKSAVLWVAEDGRTVGFGSLIDPEDPNKMYRIR